MEIYRKASLSLAVAATIALTGCFGGGGGGGGSSSNNGGGEGGGGGGTPPAVTNYTLTIQTPQLAAQYIPASHSERVLAAVLNALITPAFAAPVVDPEPEDFRVVIINGDDNGTPDDPSDDIDAILHGGEDFDVEQSGGNYRLGLPFAPQVTSYIGVEVQPGLEFTVLTHSENLVADPVSTFITRVVSSHAGQLDQLTLEELDALIEEILELTEDPILQQQINQAYQQASDTEELLAGVAAQLSSTIESKVEEAVTPPLPAGAVSQAEGDYHFIGMSVGNFSDAWSGGVLLSGHNSSATLRVQNDIATLTPDGTSLEFEAVHPVGGSAEVRAELLEDDASTISIDSRGLTSPVSESVGSYEKGSDEVEQCEVDLANCTDRNFNSAVRMLAAGPADGRFNTLIGSSYNDRKVTDGDNQTLLDVVGGFIDLAVRKPSAPVQLRGAYGTLEYTIQVEDDDPDTLDFEAWLVDMNYGTSTVSYCNTLNLDLEINTGNLSHVFERTDQEDDNCVFSDGGERLYVLEEDGNLFIQQPDNSSIEGWVSADGLTILMAAQDPSADDLDDALWFDEGERATLLSVKLDENLENLAGRHYRLFSLALDARTISGNNMVGMNRFLAGTLEFDDQGKATVKASAQGQLSDTDGFAAGYNNLQQSFDIPASAISLDKGHMTVSTQLQTEGSAPTGLKLDGYVQEGGRILLLNRTLSTASSTLIGPTIAVCLNCE